MTLKDKLITKLLEEYRAELAELTLAELVGHVAYNRQMRGLPPQSLEEIARTIEEQVNETSGEG